MLTHTDVIFTLTVNIIASISNNSKVIAKASANALCNDQFTFTHMKYFI